MTTNNNQDPENHDDNDKDIPISYDVPSWQAYPTHKLDEAL